jgi:hypothetical protein
VSQQGRRLDQSTLAIDRAAYATRTPAHPLEADTGAGTAPDRSPARVPSRSIREHGHDAGPFPAFVARVRQAIGADQASSTTGEAPPPVHITIGRVIVRAVTEAPKRPPRSDAPAPAKTTLESYLARHRGGRP